MLTTGTNVKRSGNKTFIIFGFFDAHASELGQLGGVLCGESGRHVLYQNYGRGKISRKTGSQPHYRGGAARGRSQDHDRKALIIRGWRPAGEYGWWRNRSGVGIFNFGSRTRGTSYHAHFCSETHLAKQVFTDTMHVQV